MPLGKALNACEKQRILDLRSSGQSIRQISKTINRSKTAVFQFIKNGDNYGGTMKRGPKQKISCRTKRIIIKEASNKMTSCAKIRHQLDLNISRESVRKVLIASEHLTYVKVNQRQCLSRKHQFARIEWAMDKVGWNEEWNNILFSDEKKWNLDGPDGYAYYWHDLRKEKLIFSKRQFGGGSVITWAGFSSRGRTPIAFTTHRINSTIYQRTLEENLVPYFINLTTENGTFQQDNATCHVSASTRKWFDDNNINILQHPCRSPDLNPMENLWGLLARDVYEGGRQFNNINNLKTQILASWDRISNVFLKSLVDSMKGRIAELLLKRGGHINK